MSPYYLVVAPRQQTIGNNHFTPATVHGNVPPQPGPPRDVTDEDILRAVRAIYGPAVNASEIADELDVSRQLIDRRLRAMCDRGLVNTRMIGRVRVWWLDDEGERLISEAD